RPPPPHERGSFVGDGRRGDEPAAAHHPAARPRRRGAQPHERAALADHVALRRRRRDTAPRLRPSPRLPPRRGRMMAPPDALAAPDLPTRRGGGSYSRFVQAMKLFLPAIAVGLVMLVAAWPSLQESLEKLRPKLPRLDLSDARDLRMVN